jgi:hypothetical protein
MILDGFGALGAPSQRETECCLAHHLPSEKIFSKFRGGLLVQPTRLPLQNLRAEFAVGNAGANFHLWAD